MYIHCLCPAVGHFTGCTKKEKKNTFIDVDYEGTKIYFSYVKVCILPVKRFYALSRISNVVKFKLKAFTIV